MIIKAAFYGRMGYNLPTIFLGNYMDGKRGGFKWETEINCAFSRMHGLNEIQAFICRI